MSLLGSSTFSTWSLPLSWLRCNRGRFRHGEDSIRLCHGLGSFVGRHERQEFSKQCLFLLLRLGLPRCYRHPEATEGLGQRVIAVTVQRSSKVRHLNTYDFVKSVHEFRQTTWMPLNGELQQVVDGLGSVVVPPTIDPRLLLARLEDIRTQDGLDVSPEVLAQCGGNGITLCCQFLGCLAECDRVFGVDETTVVEDLGDQSVAHRLLHTALVAHVVNYVVTQMLDAQQVGGVAEDFTKGLRKALLLVGTDHEVVAEPNFSAAYGVGK